MIITHCQYCTLDGISIYIYIYRLNILCSKFLPQHPLRNFPKVLCLAIYFALHVSLNFPVMFELYSNIAIIISLHKWFYDRYVHLLISKGLLAIGVMVRSLERVLIPSSIAK